MDFSEKTLTQKYVFKGRIMNVRVDDVQLPDGTPDIREVIEHSGGACVLPLTDDGEVLMVKQFRYPHLRLFLEIPAGKLEKGEDPFECVKRELSEETGMVADEISSLGKLVPTPAYDGEVIHMYLATGLHSVGQKLDEGEFLQLEKYPLDTLVQMVMNGEIEDAKTVTAVLKTKRIVDEKNI